jgi:DNA-binding response OmpR family regulator
MKILIIEDEIPAYNKLVASLGAYYGDDITHDWSRSNADAEQLLNQNTYDLFCLIFSCWMVYLVICVIV